MLATISEEIGKEHDGNVSGFTRQQYSPTALSLEWASVSIH